MSIAKEYDTSDAWNDGTCKTCGSVVIEMGVTDPEDLMYGKYEYMNRCTNPACKHYYWHYTDYSKILDYYKHK